jgi:hypothetical protein
MTKSTFEELVKEIKSLSLDEQQRLKKLLDAWLPRDRSQLTEDEFEQELYEAGLLSEIKPPVRDFTAYQNRQLIEPKGKPLSEIIIEERG